MLIFHLFGIIVGGGVAEISRELHGCSVLFQLFRSDDFYFSTICIICRKSGRRSRSKSRWSSRNYDNRDKLFMTERIVLITVVLCHFVTECQKSANAMVF